MMCRYRIITITVIGLLLSGCAGYIAEHNEATRRGAEAQFGRMMERDQQEPRASDPRWAISTPAAKSYLSRLEQLATMDIETLLSQATDTPIDCQLNEETRAAILDQKTPAAVQRDLAREAKTVRREQQRETIVVVAGKCANASIEGPFSAVFTRSYRAIAPGFSMNTATRGRIDGTMVNGRLDGEVRVIRSTDTGQPNRNRLYSIGNYQQGELFGSELRLSRTNGGSVTFFIETLEQGWSRTITWMNNQTNTRYHTLNGAMEGWLEFASAVLRDSPQCYRAGEMLASGEYCQRIAADLERLARIGPTEVGKTVDTLQPQPAAAPLVQLAPEQTTVVVSDVNSTWRAPQVETHTSRQLPNQSQLPKGVAPGLLARLQNEFRDDFTTALTPDQGIDCILDNDTKHTLVFQLTEQEYRQQRQAQEKAGMVFTESPLQVIVAAGNCNEGKLDGPFTAYYRYDEALTISNAYKTRHEAYGRVEGTLSDGKLNGNITRKWINYSLPGSMRDTMMGVGISSYQDGKRTAEEMQLSVMPSMRLTLLLLLTSEFDQHELVRTWSNGKLQFSSLMKNGVADGYTKYYDPSLKNLQQCFRDGVEINDKNYCDGLRFD